MVTGRGGIKEMDLPVTHGLSVLSAMVNAHDALPAEDMAFLIAGNAFLYPYNLHNFFVLREKGEVPGFERLRGEDLDRGLVVLEQTLVQRFIDAHVWPNAQAKWESLRRITAGFSNASPFVKSVQTQVFGAAFDFGSLDDRIRLGIALVARLRWLG